MKRRVALLLLLGLSALFCCLAGRAQSIDEALAAVDTGAMQAVADEAGLDVGATLRGLATGTIRLDAQQALDAAARMARERLSSAGAWMLALCLPSMALAILKRLSGDGAAARAAGTVCYLAAASVLVGLATRAIDQARQAVGLTIRLNDALFPALTTLLAATGRSASAAAFTPAASLFGGVLGWAVVNLIFPLCGCCAALIVAGNLSEGVKLDGMTGLIVSAGKWILGLCSTLLMGVLSVQGLLGSGQDGASIRTARYAVDSLLPIIGGDVGDALELIGSNAALIKSATGATGLILLAALTAGPIIELAGVMFLTRMAAALTEPIESGRAQKMMAQFSEVLGVLVASVATSALLTVLLVGAVLRVG
jgi:stage III sporulation protein AE